MKIKELKEKAVKVEVKNKKYKISDIIPPCIVCFKKHNGKGRPITYRTICITHIDTHRDKTYITYDSYSGKGFTDLEDNKVEIMDVITLKTIDDVQEIKKENEILKEIIKRASSTHLGDFKGVDLDKKLKEILE